MTQEKASNFGEDDKDETTNIDVEAAEAQIEIPKRFYCHWKLSGDIIQYDTKHKEIKDDLELGTCCFNHYVGLPTRKWEADEGSVEVIPVELTHFNHRMMRNYHRHLKYSQNKCRGSGASEILSIRYMIFKYAILQKVPNRKCIIRPGTSSKLSDEFASRIKAICDVIPQIYFQIPTSNTPKNFLFKRTDGGSGVGGIIRLTTATADATRGYENVGDIDDEEVAHWDMQIDKPVFYAAQGVHEKTRCHLLHNTTPKGKRGFYHDLVWAVDATSDFYKHVTNWREVIGLPVETIEELYPLGKIDEKMLIQLRKDCLKKYKTDPHYRNWYHTFERQEVKVFWDNGKLIPITELVDIPIPILDVNSIVSDSRTDRSHYDQENDNLFISTESRAIGDFAEDDYDAMDLREQLNNYNKEHNIKDKFDESGFD